MRSIPELGYNKPETAALRSVLTCSHEIDSSHDSLDHRIRQLGPRIDSVEIVLPEKLFDVARNFHDLIVTMGTGSFVRFRPISNTDHRLFGAQRSIRAGPIGPAPRLSWWLRGHAAPGCRVTAFEVVSEEEEPLLFVGAHIHDRFAETGVPRIGHLFSMIQ